MISSQQWSDILTHVCHEHEISPISFDTWLRPLQISHIDGNTVYISVPLENGTMAIDYLNKKYKLPLQVAFGEIANLMCEVVFILPNEAEKLMEPKADATDINRWEKANLNKNYTFDRFIVGSNNRFAQSAALAVAESPGEIYNPLFLYSGVGLGKTHLMHSIGHFILDNNPNANVLYVTSEVFTYELIESIRNGNNSAQAKFREKYRNVDVLLVDDIQFIIGKESTQEEFFNTFNHLHSLNKQIVISSDKPPKEMETLEERLRTRFEMGLIADISSPDYETRMAIIRKKEELIGYNIPDDVINYIAENVKSNIRELEGALNRLIAFANLEGKPITLELAESELKDLVSPDAPREITPNLILKVVADHFNITISDLASKKRTAEIVIPRQIFMYLCRSLTDYSLKNVGELIGGRDHATILSGCRKISNDIANDDVLRGTVETIKKKLTPY